MKEFYAKIFPKSAEEFNRIAKNKHDSGIEKILQNPSLIGIKNSQFKEKEIRIFDGKKMISEVDIWIADDYTCYLIEYKSTNCRSNKSKAKKQLLQAKKFIEEKYLRDNVMMLYAYNGNEVLELTELGYFKKFP